MSSVGTTRLTWTVPGVIRVGLGERERRKGGRREENKCKRRKEGEVRKTSKEEGRTRNPDEQRGLNGLETSYTSGSWSSGVSVPDRPLGSLDRKMPQSDNTNGIVRGIRPTDFVVFVL